MSSTSKQAVTRREMLKKSGKFALGLVALVVVRGSLSEVTVKASSDPVTVAEETEKRFSLIWDSAYPELITGIGWWEGPLLFTINRRPPMVPARYCIAPSGSLIEWWELQRGRYVRRYSFRV